VKISEQEELYSFDSRHTIQSFAIAVRSDRKRPTQVDTRKRNTMGLSPENVKILSFIFDSISRGKNPKVEFNKFLMELVKNRIAKPSLLKSQAYTVATLTFEECIHKMRPYAANLYKFFDEIATPIRVGFEGSG
jgi:hypothetical protein